ncbi:MAG: hypothetical protein ACKN9T_16650 [Candidatus Methylumidiphilus sp.]
MSSTIWINIRNGDRYENNGEDHSAMYYLAEFLDGLTEKLHVPTLSGFFDDTDMRYNLDESGDFEDCETGWPAEEANWFPAADVLKTVSALLSHLQAHPHSIKSSGGWTQADLLEELADCQNELQRAADEAKPVHLCIVM